MYILPHNKTVHTFKAHYKWASIGKCLPCWLTSDFSPLPGELACCFLFTSGDYRNSDWNHMRAVVEFDLPSSQASRPRCPAHWSGARSHTRSFKQHGAFTLNPQWCTVVCVSYRCAVAVFNLGQAVAICLVFLGVAGHEVYWVTYMLVSASDDTDHSFDDHLMHHVLAFIFGKLCIHAHHFHTTYTCTPISGFCFHMHRCKMQSHYTRTEWSNFPAHCL